MKLYPLSSPNFYYRFSSRHPLTTTPANLKRKFHKIFLARRMPYPHKIKK